MTLLFCFVSFLPMVEVHFAICRVKMAFGRVTWRFFKIKYK